MTSSTVFLSVPLIGLLTDDLKEEVSEAPEYRRFYASIMEICKQHGLDVYDPYAHTDPKKHDYIRPTEIYLKNRDIISSAIDLLIAYVGVVSAGVSIEIEMANHYGVPAIIMYEADRYNQVSRMILGCPNTKHRIVATNINGLAAKLDQNLPNIVAAVVEERQLALRPRSERLNRMLSAIHDDTELSINQVASLAGIDKGYVSRLLSGKIVNPGRDQLIRLCGWGWKLTRDRTNEVLRVAGYHTLW